MNKNEIQEYLKKMQTIQTDILQYLDDDEKLEENFENIINFINDQKILEDQHELKSLLHLITKIANNHHRNMNFFEKIENILQYLQANIKNYFSNYEIFNIFKNNKRIFLYLIENKIIEINQSIVNQIQSYRYHKSKYNYYFYPEFKSFLNSENDVIFTESGIEIRGQKTIEEKIPNDFNEKRIIGENHNEILQIIRNDSIDEFEKYVKKTKMSLNSEVESSIYETNIFLSFQPFGLSMSLIEYAAFFGSIQIFNYMHSNGCKLTDKLWKSAIHSNNLEIIKVLESKKVKPPNKSYEDLFMIAITCHHNDIANYINSKHLKKKGTESLSTTLHCLSHYNFAYINEDFIDNESFFYLCRYDYYLFVKALLQKTKINVNQITVLFCIIF